MKFCKCGCGGVVREDKKYVSEFIHGHNNIDIKFSEEHRMNLSKSLKGKPSKMKGKTREELVGKEKAMEWINKIRSGNLGKVVSEGTRQKLSLNNARPWIGRKHTEKTKQKMREASLGERNHNYGKRPSPETLKKQSIGLVERIMNGTLIPNSYYKKGYYYSKINNKTLYYRSSYEKRAYEILDDLYEYIEKYEYEPFTIEYEHNGVIRNHIPDILVYWKCGEKELINIKPSRRMKEDGNIIKSQAAQRYCEENNIVYSLWTEKELGIKKNKWIMKKKV